MGRYPREEISYTKIYKDLDLDKDLSIKWPVIDELVSEIKLTPVDINSTTKVDNNSTINSASYFDEFDEKFCTENNINKDIFIAVYKRLETDFNKYLFKKLDELCPIELSESEIVCDICGGDTDDITVCNGCGIPVHNECYGISNFTNKYWFCTKCTFHSYAGECSFCNNKNGILKMTDDNRWIHAVCTILNPTLSFSNLIHKDPVDTSEFIKEKGVCNHCNQKSESLIYCAFDGCNNGYHGSCAAENIYCDINNKYIYCPVHNFLVNGRYMHSKRRLMHYRAGYPELTEPILLRENIPLTTRKNTEFVKIIETIPFSCINEKITSKKSQDAIVDYWIAKRSALGVNFTNYFLFTDYLNKK